MAEQGLRRKLGGFVAVTLVLLGGLVVLFGGAPRLFSNRASYTVLFPEAPGVATGTPIRKSGVRIGEVATLDLDPQTGQVRVGAVVDKKFLPRPSEDAIITRGLLSGDTTIDFLPRLDEDGRPVALADPYAPGSEIVGLPPVTARSVLSQAQGIIPSTQQSLDRVVAAFEKFERLSPKVERALDEIAGLAKAGREFIPELKKTNDKLQNFIGGDTVPLREDADKVFANFPIVPGNAAPDVPQPRRAGDPRVVDPSSLRAMVLDVRDFLRAARPAVDDVRAAVRRAEPELTATAQAARATLGSARSSFDNLNDLLNPENRKQFNDLLKNLASLSGNLVRLTVALGGVVEDAQATVKSLNARVNQSEAVLNDVRALTKPLAERADRLVGNLDVTLDGLAKAVTEVRTLTQGFARSEGSVGKILSDPMLYNNLNDASISLARVLVRAERIAKDLEVFADKVARKPETIGVGGALRPNSGLKESPVAPLPSYRPDWPPAAPGYPPR